MPDVISLKEGRIVSHGDENWIIIHSEDLDRVLASRISDGHHDFLKIADLRPPIQHQEADASSEPRRIRDFPRENEKTPIKEKERNKTVMEEYRHALKVLGKPRAERRALAEEMASKFGYNLSTAYRRIRIVKVHGTPESLLRAVRTDAGNRRIAQGAIKIIRKHLKSFRFVAEAKTLPKVLELVNGKCRKQGLPEISLATLQSFEHETTLKQKLEAQGRKKKSADLFRPKVGHLPNNDYPLAIVQVDHTPLQICLVDEEDRKPINDPWLTLVIDTYSRMVLGFFLTFDPPSTLSTGMALAHAFLPKEEYLRSIGIEGEWPCWGFPDVVLVDNAAELNGQMMHGARKLYRFTLRDRPVGAPNFGGHVESAFKTFMYEFKSVPGTKFSNPVERGEYDSEGRAIFTIAEFEAFFTEFLVNDYHVHKHTGEGMNNSVPLLKWKQGIFEGDRMPPTGIPDRPADPLSLRISLMPFASRTINNSTVSLNGHEYYSGRLTMIGDKIDLTKPLEKRKFEVRFDPRNISKTWLYDDEAGDYIEIGFTDLRKRPISLWEDRAIRRRRGDPSDQFKDQRYESMLRREDMKASAARKTKQQRLEAEKEKRRAAGAIIQPPPAPPKPTAGKPVDHSRLRRMMEKVRPAATNSTSKKGDGHE